MAGNTENRIIVLSEHFRLVQDSYCCWIEKLKAGKTKDGKEKESWVRYTGYHTNYEDVTNSFFDRHCRDIEAASVKEALKEMVKIRNEVKAFAKKIG